MVLNYGCATADGRKTTELRVSDGTVHKHFMHRLVMQAFIGTSDLQVNHKDGNTQNNKLENLEYNTAKENSQHAVDTGLRVQKTVDHRQNISVIRMDMKGNELQVYESVSAA